MSACLLAAAFFALVLAMPDRDGFRDRFLRALAVFGAALLLVTESPIFGALFLEGAREPVLFLVTHIAVETVYIQRGRDESSFIVLRDGSGAGCASGAACARSVSSRSISARYLPARPAGSTAFDSAARQKER